MPRSRSCPGVFTARAGDERGSQVEVGPRGREAMPGDFMLSFQSNPSPSPHSEVHLNIYSPLSDEAVFAIAAREGWKAVACDRGGKFKLIEFWLENKFLLEIMNDEQWGRYRAWDAQGAPIGPPRP